jgi:hypothetical protein
LITSSSNGVVRPKSALLTHRVEEARAYVQGESLKASADLLDEALSTPRSPGWGDYMRVLLIAGAALLLAGCVPGEVYVMKNPKTGEIHECRPGDHGLGLFPLIESAQNNGMARDCAAGYEAAGWQRMN